MDKKAEPKQENPSRGEATDIQDKNDSANAPIQDYQLTRALDLMRGIALYSRQSADLKD